jgi:hypothetical protein
MNYAATFDGARNALVFATEAEAEKYRRELGSRWFGFKDSAVVGVAEPATYRFDDAEGQAVRLGEGS